MADVPRRLQQSGADRMGIVADRAAPGSHRGVTQWSKPPTAKTPTPQTAAESLVAPDRLTTFANISAGSLTGTSHNIGAWDGSFDVVGNGIGLNSPDDGGIYLFDEGIYAVTASLRVDATGATSAGSVMHLAMSSSEINLTPEAIWHGANEVAGNTSLPVSTVVQYAPGHGLSGGLFPLLFYPSVDPAVTGVSVSISVTRVR